MKFQSQLCNDFLTTYKYGWKTSYYQNTHDLKSDEVEETPTSEVESLLQELSNPEEGEASQPFKVSPLTVRIL